MVDKVAGGLPGGLPRRLPRPAEAHGSPGRRCAAIEAREAAVSVYDSFWYCSSGQQSTGRWVGRAEVASLGYLRSAFGLAEAPDRPDSGARRQAGGQAARGDAPQPGARPSAAAPVPGSTTS
jgi:hypothetical protein